MAGDRVEVGVLAEQLGLVADRDRGDQAVGQLARGLPLLAAEPVQLGGALVVARAFDGQELEAVEEAPQPFPVGVVAVGAFADEQIDASHRVETDAVEFHTGSYCAAAAAGDGLALARELKRLIDGAQAAAGAGLEVHAGHGLDYDNVGAVASIPEIVELNIGHYLVGEALFVGLAKSVSRMRSVMDGARESLRHSATEAKVGGG